MTIDDIIEMLNSEDCKLTTNICLMGYRERDCWKCILKEYTKTVYNKAIDDFVNKINESNQGHWRPTRYEHGEVVSETMSYDIGTIRLIAKQLKAGGENG